MSKIKKTVLKRMPAIVLIMALVLTFTACQSGTSSSGKGEILIGVCAAITGPSPLDGERMKQGIDLAIEEINAKGGVLNKNLKAIYEDDQNTANVAVNAVNKLVSQDIVALIGPHRSNNATAVSQIVTENKIPYMTGATSPKLLTLNNPYLFRIRASDALTAKMAAKFAVEELKAKKIGIFYNNDEYGIGAKDVILSYLKEKNIEGISEGHNTGDKDMTGQITKMKNSGIDALIVWTHEPEGAIIARQVIELNLNVPYIGSPTFTLPSWFALVDEKTASRWYSATDFVSTNPEPRVQDYAKKFKAKYNAEPELYAAAYYDAVYALADAIKRASSADRAKIQQALMQTKDLQGVMSKLTANDKGELVHEIIISKNNGKTPELVAVVKE